MDAFLLPSLVNGFGVFAMLIGVWQMTDFGTSRQRLVYAGVAGIWSAVLAYVIASSVYV